jgi:hypothetical protein
LGDFFRCFLQITEEFPIFGQFFTTKVVYIVINFHYEWHKEWQEWLHFSQNHLVVSHDQGDQFGRFFAYWATVYFGQFFVTEVCSQKWPLFSFSPAKASSLLFI